jgi:UDP-N-acetylmuramate dehydrogenase
MQIARDVPLAACNSLRLPARADFFCVVDSQECAGQALAYARAHRLALLVLGGGSNVVLRDRFSGLVLRMQLQGEEILSLDADAVRVRVAAGTGWHEFVMACHRRGWYGLENLALIPGTVGAAPIQNIGAYGVELDRYVEEVSGVWRSSGEPLRLSAEQCRFSYRHSVFKDELADRVLLTAVTFRLPLAARPVTDYPVLRAALAGVLEPGPADVLEAVMRIRRERLPDPQQLPNAGSFFKNPIISAEQFEHLKQQEPELVYWPVAAGVKIAAAWLVDRVGGKRMAEGDARVHQQQALVLVNAGSASAADVLRLAARIVAAVQQRFGIALEIEPAIY